MCLYSEGVMEADKTLVFKSDQIEYIYHYGLRDEEYEEFFKNLEEFIKNGNNEQNDSSSDIELPILNGNNEDIEI